MDDGAAYTARQRNHAVNLAAVLGWCVIASPIVLTGNLGMIALAAVLGLPVAFVVCWLIAAPVITRLMQHPISWLQAALWGGIVSGLMAGIAIIIGRIPGWMQSINPNSYSRLGGGENTVQIDGVLTAYGWLQVAQNTASFVICGVGIALILRAVIGAGSTSIP